MLELLVGGVGVLEGERVGSSDGDEVVAATSVGRAVSRKLGAFDSAAVGGDGAAVGRNVGTALEYSLSSEIGRAHV